MGPLFQSTLSLVRFRFGADPPFYVASAPFWLVAMLTEGFSHYVGNPFCFAVFLWTGVIADSLVIFSYKNRSGLLVKWPS